MPGTKHRVSSSLLYRHQTLVVGSVVLALILAGGVAAVFLAQSPQDLRNRAAGNNPYNGPCSRDSDCAPGYTCARDPGDNTMACMPATNPTPPPTSVLVNCKSVGQRIPEGVTLNCAR